MDQITNCGQSVNRSARLKTGRNVTCSALLILCLLSLGREGRSLPASQSSTAGLVGYWKFNGDFQDSSGRGNHAFNHGATFTSGKFGQGIALNGVDQYVTVPDHTSLDLNDFTIEAWVQIDRLGFPDTILQKMGEGEDALTNQNYGIGVHESLRVVHGFETDAPGGNDQSLFSTSQVGAGVLFHVAGTYDSATRVLKIYINGNLDGSMVVNAFPPNMNDFPISIGSAYAHRAANPFKGVIDEVRLWNVSRTDAEILADMSSELTPILKITMSKGTYINGEVVTASVFLIENSGPSQVKVELAVWLEFPGIEPISILNLGANSSLILPPNFSQELGPISLFSVTSSFTRGSYAFNSRMVNPVTKKLLSEDINFFMIQ